LVALVAVVVVASVVEEERVGEEDMGMGGDAWHAAAQPNCRNELAAVFTANNKDGAPGSACSWMQYLGNTKTPPTCGCPAYRLPRVNSPICADVGVGQGKPSITYNKANHLVYYTTGTGQLVWLIDGFSGLEQKFANVPPLAPGVAIIGLRIVGNSLVLFTTKQYFTAPLTPVPSTFTQQTDISLNIPLSIDSIVDVNPAVTDTFYFTAQLGPSFRLYTFKTSPPVATSVTIQGFSDFPRQMYWSTAISTVVATDTSDVLHRIALANGLAQPIVQTAVGTLAATIYLDLYYSSNATLTLAQSVSTGKLAWCAPVNGKPIFGNWVFLA